VRRVWDVIVIGGGAAGLRAAIAARQVGAQVLLMAKAPVGLANCTAYSGSFSLAIAGLTPEEHRAMTWETGRYLSEPDLLTTLVAEAPQRVLELQRFGVKFDVRPERLSKVTMEAYGRPPLTGVALTRPLAEYAKEQGVVLERGGFACKVLVDAEGVSGLVVVHPATCQVETYRTRALVVATGGAGAVYGRSDNPSRTSGDGHALLYRADVPLQDMEFVQFFPLGFAEPGFPSWIMPPGILDRVPLTNSQGDDLKGEWMANWGLSGSDLEVRKRGPVAVIIAREIAAGRDVFLHLNELTDAQWGERHTAWLKRIYPRHFDPTLAPVRVAPIAHYTIGGVAVTTQGETSVPGLFACGEVTGGLDGADRLGGNALSACIVFGARAGQAAAQHALATSPRSVGSDEQRVTERIRRWTGNEAGPRPEELRSKINRLADDCLGPAREATGMRHALAELEKIADQLGRQTLREQRDLLEALEVESLCLVAQLIGKAAMARMESRGVHFRSDYPAEDNLEWRKHIVLQKKGESVEIRYHQADQPTEQARHS